MFTEILKVKPVLDEAAAKKMTTSLSTRLMRVAKVFGKGLKTAAGGFDKAMKATFILGILGAVTKLLNPLNEVEERIKALLGQGSSLKETAEQLGTNAGKLRTLQDIAGIQGVDESKFTTLFESFAKVLQETRDAKAKPGQKLTEIQSLVSSLDTTGDASDALYNLIQTMGVNDAKGREFIQKGIFGGVQKGAAGRFLTGNVDAMARQLPSWKQADGAIQRGANLDAQLRKSEIIQNAKADITQTGLVSPQAIVNMANARQAEIDKQTSQIKNVEMLQQASANLNKIAGLIDSILGLITKGLSLLGPLAAGVEKLVSLISNSKAMKYLGLGGK